MPHIPRTVSMLLVLAAIPVAIGVVVLGTIGLGVFTVGFLAGWGTSIVWQRRHRHLS